MREDYKERLSIPVVGNDYTEFYDKDGQLVATGYTRIVIGERGPYVEFMDKHMFNNDLYYIPESEEWRLNSSAAYYWEFRTKGSEIKIYAQRRTVDYADYKVGMWYMSPFELYDSSHKVLI